MQKGGIRGSFPDVDDHLVQPEVTRDEIIGGGPQWLPQLARSRPNPDMRNITVSVPEEVYRQAKIKAAEKGRSVSSLVAEFLSTLGEGNDEFEQLLAQQEEVLGEIESFRAGDRLGRDQLHGREIR